MVLFREKFFFLKLLAIFRPNLPTRSNQKCHAIFHKDNLHIYFKNLIGFAAVIWFKFHFLENRIFMKAIETTYALSDFPKISQV